jgi:hypothetical protein
MAGSLLDINFDIDKLLGTTNQPLAGLITDPNYNSSLNVDTLLGAGLGYTNSLYKDKTLAEKLLSTATGAKAARTKGINDAVKKLLQTQDYTKNMLNITKTQGDILQQPFDLQSKKVQSVLDTSKLDGIQRYVKTLPPMKAAELAIDPEKYFGNNKITEEERMLYKTLGIQDRFNIPPKQAGMVTYFNQLPNQKDVDAHNAEENRKAQQDPLYKPNYLNNGKLDFIKRLGAANNTGTSVNQQLEQQTVAEGMIRMANNKTVSQEEYDALPEREKEYLDPDLDLTTFRKNKGIVVKERRDDKKMIGYGMSGNRDVAQNIEKILDDPEKLNTLFTQSGRFAVRFNDATGGWIAEGGGVAADVARYLNSLKAKQFTQQIQFMRQNNPTGGAVGNVSDREVSMFQNMQEYLGDMGSGEKLYEALVDLYSKTKVMNDEYKDFYIDDYGKNYWDNSLQDREIKFKQYAPSLKQAIEGDKIDAANPQQIPQINNVEEALKLPKGTIFKDANGTTRRR